MEQSLPTGLPAVLNRLVELLLYGFLVPGGEVVLEVGVSLHDPQRQIWVSNLQYIMTNVFNDGQGEERKECALTAITRNPTPSARSLMTSIMSGSVHFS